MASRRIKGLSELAGRYDAILCDVWGVVHNGVAAWPGAVAALSAFRAGGGTVVFITNAPRPNGPVREQLATLGVTPQAYDAVVTSGDVTRLLIEDMAQRAYHIGPERDFAIYDGLGIELVGPEQAQAAVCTGLFDDTTETPEDYAGLLARLKQLDLPFLCANPDIVVERGDVLIWCAGALARDYAAIGGAVHIVGKPHRPIYERAVAVLAAAARREPDRKRILAIGDGMATDVAGAAAFGLDLLYISSGIHAEEYGPPDDPDVARLEAFLATMGAAPVAWMPRLKW